jgi:hypothetical protein
MIEVYEAILSLPNPSCLAGGLAFNNDPSFGPVPRPVRAAAGELVIRLASANQRISRLQPMSVALVTRISRPSPGYFTRLHRPELNPRKKGTLH